MIKPPNWSAILVMHLFSVAMPTTSYAQDAPSVNYTAFDATSAKPVQLGYYATARKDCAPAPAPVIRVIEASRSGTLTVRGGELTTSNIAGCPRFKTQAQVVFYQARVGAVGTDHVVYAVTNAVGKMDAYDVTINIKEAPKSPVPDSEKPI